MCWGTLGTVRPFPNFHPERDAVVLQAALEKKGSMFCFPFPFFLTIPLILTLISTDSDTVTLVRILTNRSNAQRQALAKTFEEITQKVINSAPFNLFRPVVRRDLKRFPILLCRAAVRADI